VTGNRPEEQVQAGGPQEQVHVRFSKSALVHGDQTRPFEFLDVIPRLAIGDAKADAKGFKRWVTACVLTGEAEQTNVAELRARADAAML